MSTLVITDLVKSFTSHKIIDTVSFTARPGDVVALLGSSGCGKSTLLRCVNQLEAPESGTIQLGDIVLKFPCKQNKAYQQTVYQLRRRVGMVFQQFNLWPHMTVMQNLLEAPLRVLGKSRDESFSEAMRLLEKVGLVEKKDVYPTYLSGGQQQRVAIARALMMKPELMLFDEPTSALDPEMSREVLTIIKKLVDEGMMLLIATHEIGFAREAATHLMFLDKGKVMEFGPAQDVFARPKTQRFRDFLESESKSNLVVG